MTGEATAGQPDPLVQGPAAVVAAPPSWRRLARDAAGGCSAALVVLPIILSCGAVAYQSLGGTYVARGITSAFVSAILAALVASLFEGRSLHVNAPKTTHAALLSLLMMQVARSPDFAQATMGRPELAGPGLISVALAALLVSGLLQGMVGLLRLGHLVRFIPRPVLAGLVNGFALQIILIQAPRAFGAASLADLVQFQPVAPGPLCVAAAAGALTLASRRLSHFIPAPLIGLAAGLALAAGLEHVQGPGAAGPAIGSLQLDLSSVTGLLGGLAGAPTGILRTALAPIVQTGITLALVSSIQSLLNLAAADTRSGARHDAGRALLVQGGSNALAAMLGGTPTGGSANVTQAAFAAGARGRVANLAHAGCLLLVLLAGRSAIATLPLSVMAAVVIVTTLGSIDGWSRRLVSSVAFGARVQGHGRQWADLGVVVLVAALLLTAGALAALAAGMAVAALSFVGRTRQFFVRSVLRGDAERSRTSRDAACAEALTRNGGRIIVMALQGPLFFGTAEYLLDRIEADTAGADYLVLDFTRLTDADITGIVALRRVRTLAARSGKVLLMAGLEMTPRLQALFTEAGLQHAVDLEFDTLDAALCQAEDSLLRSLGLEPRSAMELSISGMALLAPLPPAQAAILESFMLRRSYSAGAAILQAGDPGEAAFFLCSGEIAAVRHVHGKPMVMGRHRPGTLFGEMALLTGHVRSATVEALTDVVVQELSLARYQSLLNTHPDLAAKLLQAIARQLSVRVRELDRALESLS